MAQSFHKRPLDLVSSTGIYMMQGEHGRASKVQVDANFDIDFRTQADNAGSQRARKGESILASIDVLCSCYCEQV